MNVAKWVQELLGLDSNNRRHWYNLKLLSKFWLVSIVLRNALCRFPFEVFLSACNEKRTQSITAWHTTIDSNNDI